MRTTINVNQHIIRSNKKNEEHEPPLTAKNHLGNTKAHRLALFDEAGKKVAEVIYNPDKPLDCGATCWIQTDLSVKAVK